MPRSIVSGPAAVGALLALTLLGLANCKARAQAAEGEPVDVRVEIVNGTTGEPGAADRLLIEYLAERPNVVLDVEPAGPTVVLEDVPLKELGKYVVTVWKDGVPYFFSRRGRELRDETQTLHVFDTTTDRAGVRVDGLTLALRRQESLLRVELMLQVQNEARPQVTVVGSPGSIVLDLPAGLTDVAAEYHRGLDPAPVATTRTGDGLALAVPLVSGTNRLRLTATMPWRDGLDFSLGADVPIDGWDLLVAPAWTELASLELEPAPDAAAPGYMQYRGPALEADRTLEFRLASGAAAPGPEEDLFTSEAPAAVEEAPETDDGGGGVPWPILLLVAAVLLVLVMRRRRT